MVATAVELIVAHIIVIANLGPSTANATHLRRSEIIVIVRAITISFGVVIAMITATVSSFAVRIFATIAVLTGCGNWCRLIPCGLSHIHHPHTVHYQQPV
jgi:hypothetical protein